MHLGKDSSGIVNLQKLIDYEKIMRLKMDKRYTVSILQHNVDKKNPFTAIVTIIQTNGFGEKFGLISHQVEIKHPFGNYFLYVYQLFRNNYILCCTL